MGKRNKIARARTSGEDLDYAVALALAYAGDTTQAQGLADDLGKRFADDTITQVNYLPTLRAKLALNHSNPQVDIAKFFAGLSMDHAEEVACNRMYGMLSKSQELQLKLTVPAILEVNTVVGVSHFSSSSLSYIHATSPRHWRFTGNLPQARRGRVADYSLGIRRA
ncbi:MAG: hypothetical protein DMG38_28360 [Acidobacteria bacterium]|nr:MAG: hypothetical protein DMG38_28360 [Acidobacteriota bacterium]